MLALIRALADEYLSNTRPALWSQCHLNCHCGVAGCIDRGSTLAVHSRETCTCVFSPPTELEAGQHDV